MMRPNSLLCIMLWTLNASEYWFPELTTNKTLDSCGYFNQPNYKDLPWLTDDVSPVHRSVSTSSLKVSLSISIWSIHRLFSRIVLEGNFEILRYYLPFYFRSICSFESDSHWLIFQPREGSSKWQLSIVSEITWTAFLKLFCIVFRSEWSQIWPACAKKLCFLSNFLNHNKIRRDIPKYDFEIFSKREKYDLEPDKVGSPALYRQLDW